MEAQVRATAVEQSVDQRLAAMKRDLGLASAQQPARLDAPVAGGAARRRAARPARAPRESGQERTEP
jgi:hypothetical protein